MKPIQTDHTFSRVIVSIFFKERDSTSVLAGTPGTAAFGCKLSVVNYTDIKKKCVRTTNDDLKYFFDTFWRGGDFGATARRNAAFDWHNIKHNPSLLAR
jgi:hypothetical protein